MARQRRAAGRSSTTRRRPASKKRRSRLPPPDLRPRLEQARIDLRALFRSLDQLRIAQDLPPELLLLFQLDADLAEALWALDQSPGRINFSAMTADTYAALDALPNVLLQFLFLFDIPLRQRLRDHALALRSSLDRTVAYLQVPGRDPTAPAPSR